MLYLRIFTGICKEHPKLNFRSHFSRNNATFKKLRLQKKLAEWKRLQVSESCLQLILVDGH